MKRNERKSEFLPKIRITPSELSRYERACEMYSEQWGEEITFSEWIRGALIREAARVLGNSVRTRRPRRQPGIKRR